MDWREDLKLSFIKSAVKKGRRSSQKSHEQKQHHQQQQQQQSSLPSEPSSPIAQILSASPPNVSSPSLSYTRHRVLEKDDSLSIDLDISIDSHNDNKILKTPPKKITAGWADSISKSGKNRHKNVTEEFTKEAVTTKYDDIPIIPDLDDIQDELLMNEIVEPPSVTVNRVVTLKELDSDLLKQSAFSTLEDVDLSILTKHLQLQETLDEPDEVWEWDKIFTEISVEIHSEESTAKNKNERNDELIQTQYLS